MGDLQRAFAKRLGQIEQRVVGRAEDAQREAVKAGALALDHALEAAVTDTGYFRMLIAGGRPGRHDTGNMVSKIRTNADAPERRDDVVWRAFGWFAGDFEAYFREQDLGTPPLPGARRGIPPAHGMSTASSVARETLRTRMRQL